MKRQNVDGRSIYSDKVWQRMLRLGHNLEQIGYQESKKKPNLFFKSVDDNEEKGVMFADLRGTSFVPIWDDTRPITYSLEISFKRYIKEVILLERNQCSPRTTFEQDSEAEGWAIDIGIPDGYCKGCGKDIIHEADWDLLEEGIFNEKIKKNEGIEWIVEVVFCEDCKVQEVLIKNFLKEEYKKRR